MDSASNGLDPTSREVVRGLLRGATPEDLAWASGRSAEDVLELTHEALSDLGGEADIKAADRRRIVEYLLLRQSPGQAAGTWELLEGSPPARAWASRAREHISELYTSEPPPLPGDEHQSVSPDGAGTSARDGPLARRRAERRRLRTKAEVEAAVAVATSPFREEAVRQHAEREDKIRLPHYASRPLRLSIYGLLGTFAVVLALCAIVSVPVYTTAKVLVVDLSASAPSGERGPTVVALFPADALDKVKKGSRLRVQLPDTEGRVGMRIAYVEDEVRGPKEIADRYGLPQAQATRVRDPHVVAVAPLRTPDGAPPGDSFEGVVTIEAAARTGSERIIGLLL